jgi:hypothetical protein
MGRNFRHNVRFGTTKKAGTVIPEKTAFVVNEAVFCIRQIKLRIMKILALSLPLQKALNNPIKLFTMLPKHKMSSQYFHRRLRSQLA